MMNTFLRNETTEQAICRIARQLNEGFEADAASVSRLASCLHAATAAGIDENLSRSLLLGLAACKEYQHTIHPHLAQMQFGAEARISRDGRGTSAFRGYRDERNDLNRFAFERREVLIVIGYMRDCGSEFVSKRYLAPLTPCLVDILGLSYSTERGHDPVHSVYKNLWNRANNLFNKNGREITLSDATEFFQEIHSTLCG